MKFGFGEDGCRPHPRDLAYQGLEHELAGLHPNEIKRRVRYGLSDISQVKMINIDTGETITLKEFEEEYKMECKVENSIVTKSVLVKFVGGYNSNKNYVFNVSACQRATLDAIKVGTIISTKLYTNDMVICSILGDRFKYVNKNNGDMKYNITNTSDMKIVEINLDKLTQIVSFVEV